MGSLEDNQSSFSIATQRLFELKNIIEDAGGKALPTPFIFSIFPGTKVWNKYKKYIQYDIQKYPELYQLNTAVHRTEYFNAHQITLEKKKMEEYLFTGKQYNSWNKTGRYQWS